ncbi:N-ethylmaleimide reductase [Herbaspirillum sp. Sphag1AN]|uniref:alkene reductase n=1 Tax=unclassified Herbaspirillum TaxID=2624150 RepID=UPI001609E366|nr:MULTISPECIES: alkene reductase [unclassified Herbaspirillum]MBB3214702.1 N-ethylmaleimide reductase [Herbaspirillum sp. Sphag1AN]MBB3247895.1 N-ethylmaleimide reductase [Herbaspirillum sp. Sphag64]
MSDFSSNPVLQPVTIGGLQLKNRIVMAPMTRSRSDDFGVPPDYAADYYAQRASAGLIITEATNISAAARGYPRTPGIWNAVQIAAWQRVTDAVHQRQGKIFLQLWHTGRMSHPDMLGGAIPVAASAIKPHGQIRVHDGMKDFVTPRALRTDEIPAIVEDYRRAAENAKRAGFDGVEVHSANNYLLEQFVRDSTNHRTDQYGGSLENRLRFPLEVVKAVVDVWGPQRVGIRISPTTTTPGNTPLDSNTMQTFSVYIDALSTLGLLYLHEIEGVTQLSRDADDGISFAALRQRFKGAYVANNQYTLALAEKTLAAGDADLFSIGRPFIANPDLIERLRNNAPLADAPKQYWYGGDARGYSDWPGMQVPRQQ